MAMLIAVAASAQTPSDWYHAGNSLVDLSLAGLAGGPVSRVWYSPGGGTLYVTIESGQTFETNDFEKWSPSQAAAPPASDLSTEGTVLPEPGARLKGFNGQRSTMYAFGAQVYESTDGGSGWDNRTEFHSRSIIGGAAADLAISPRDPEDVTVATSAGVFRSLNGGRSWHGLNDGLPNLPALRLWALPSGDRGAEIEIPGNVAVEWQPGEKQAWRPVENRELLTEAQVRLGLSVSAIQAGGSVVYMGTSDGRITAQGSGAPLEFSPLNAGKVERFWVDPTDSRIALAVLGARPDSAVPGVAAPHVLHTVDGGANWDDLTANLPDVAVHGVTASRSSRAIYLATDSGVYFTRADVSVLSFPTAWQPVAGLPQAPVSDVRLDAGDNSLWAAVEGYGVYSTIAPHRIGDPKVVSAADMVARAAAPGSVMSVLGAKLSSALAGDLPVQVLKTSATESQIQIPFEASGNTLSLLLAPESGSRVVEPLPLATTSPGILVDVDGTPMLRDADTGMMLDASNPAHSRTRIQIFATGLGRVNPDWPAGKPAPADDPPKVIAPVAAYLGRVPVQVTQARLAPGYAGLYLVEVELPELVNYGPADLRIEAAGHASNPVRVYIEP